MIKEIVAQKREETEETSLKFSNLSPEELTLWKEGRPSPELSFELSFWSDLAKWCFNQQEDQKPYEIEFIDGDQKLPHAVQIEFTDAFISFYVVRWDGKTPSPSGEHFSIILNRGI